MQKFFRQCRKWGLSLAPAKCKLFWLEVVFGGVTISATGITLNDDKIVAVIDWPESKMSHELWVSWDSQASLDGTSKGK